MVIFNTGLADFVMMSTDAILKMTKIKDHADQITT